MLILPFDPIIGAPYTGLGLSDVARIFSAELIGRDAEIKYQGSLDFAYEGRSNMLTYLLDTRYLPEFLSRGIDFAIIPKSMVDSDLPEERSYLVTKENPLDLFNAIHMFAIENALSYRVESRTGSGCRVSRRASIHENVSIGDRVTIDDFVVVYPNTVIGNDVRIQANSVIGGDGFEVRILDGQNKILPHSGGTILEDNVEVCSLCTVDRSLRHTFTFIGRGTKLSNHVQIGHGASLRENCVITGHGQIGNCRLGKGVFVCPSACIKPQLTLGDFVYVGMGSVVLNSAPSYALLYGNPARFAGWVCECRSRMEFGPQGRAVCQNCGRVYAKDGDLAICGS